MPYVDDDDKKLLDQYPDSATLPGSFTYLLQQLAQKHLLRRLGENGKLAYADIQEVLGCTEGFKADYIDRILLPYERRKRHENGDVWSAELLHEIAHTPETETP